MEGFARLVIAGGIGLVVGLWVLELAAVSSPAWVAGGGLAVVSGVALLAGIARRLSWPRE